MDGRAGTLGGWRAEASFERVGDPFANEVFSCCDHPLTLAFSPNFWGRMNVFLEALDESANECANGPEIHTPQMGHILFLN